MNLLLLLFFILLVLLYDVLSIKLNISSTDELIMVFLSLYAIMVLFKKKIFFLKEEKYIFIFFISIILLGFLGSFFSNLQPIKIQLIDIIIFIKFFIVYFSMRIILISKNYDYTTSNIMLFILLFIAFFIFSLVMQDRILDLFPIFDFKYFNIGSEELFFGHPSRFAFAIEMILLLLFPLLKKNNTMLYIFIPLLILGALSLRTKYFIFVFLFIGAIILLKFFKLKYISVVKISFISIFLISFILIFAHNDILQHILPREDGGQGVRGRLLFAGYNIALNHFPLGAGFGSFGSYASTVNYSPLYYIYHFDIIPGCMPDKPSFLADNFFAMVLGQFGFIGLICFLLILALFVKILLFLYNHDYTNRYYYISALLMIVIVFYESFSDSILSQNRGVFIAIYLAYIISKFRITKDAHEK